MTKTNRWIIGLDGTYIGTPNKKLTGFSDNTEEVVLIAPFDIASAVSFGVGNEHRTVVTQYLSLSDDVVSDWVEENETFGSLTYQDIADWHVWRIALRATAKAYVSKFRGSFVYFSFRVGTIGTNAKTILYKGVFGVDNPLPATLQVTGDYYTCEDIYYTQTVDTKNDVPLVFGHGMHVYWSSADYWVKVSENMVLNTTSAQQAVDPSFAVADEVDDDEVNYLVSFESVLYEHEARLDQVELDIAANEQAIDNLEDGSTVIPTYELVSRKTTSWGTPNDTEYPTTKLVDDRLDPIETFKDTTVPATYETIANADTHRGRTTALETANMVKSIAVVGTNLFTLTFYDDTTSNILTLVELKSFIGEATQSLNGLMSITDKQRLDALHAMLGVTADADNVVNTINEIMEIFATYPEGADILEALNGKANKIDVYTKPETYTQQEINALFDNLSSVKGLKSTLLTPTELSNGDTISTNLLTNNGAYIIFTATNVDNDEIDSDTVPISTIKNGKKFVFFDNQEIVFTIGETNSTFETSEDITLKINLLYLDNENTQAINVDFDGSLTNYLLNQTNVQEALEKLDNELKTTNDNLNNHTNDMNNPHDVTKTQIGLGNVDDTSDLDKPISTAQQTALDNKVNVTRKIADIDLQDDITKQELKVALDVDDIETANMIKSITRSGSNLFTITYYDDTTSSLLTLTELKSFIGEATQSLSGLMSAQDKVDLDTLMALFDADGDSVVNTIAEILAIFENYPEGADLVTALAGKVDKTSIIDNLTTNDATKVLSAKQGKVLDDTVALKVNTSDIVNNLTSTDTNKPLSANQGKALKDLIDTTVGDIDSILDSILGV